MSKIDKDIEGGGTEASRRATLKKLGKYAAVSAPVVTVLLAATTKPKVAVAASEIPAPP